MYDIFYLGNSCSNFEKLTEKYPLIRSVTTFEEAKKKSLTKFFWVIPSDVVILDSFNFDYTPDEWSQEYVHVFRNSNNWNGIILSPKSVLISNKEIEHRFFINKKEVDIVASTPRPYDVVFISYGEPNADENYNQLLKKIPTAKRIHGVKGIHQAHIAAAKLCSTPMFWIIDGDAQLIDEFEFDYQVARWDQETVHVWRSINPINDLVYGYGGVKLFPTQLTIDMDTSTPDMTTSISNKFKAVDCISNITAFNTDPFNTWKSAFRECVKLSSKTIDRQNSNETEERLSIWCSSKYQNRQYGKYAIDGAKAGRNYGLKNSKDIDTLKKINDFDWLKEQFDEQYS